MNEEQKMKLDRRKLPSRPKAARKGSTRHILRKKKPGSDPTINSSDIDEFLDNGWTE